MIWGPAAGRGDHGDDLDDLTDEALLAAYPWPDGPWVRAMMVTTLDGAFAGPDGRSGSISSEADKRVFDTVRRLADAVVVGAGTIRAEGYGAMRAKERDAARRAAAGQAPAPVLAIVSGSLDLPWDSELFARSAVRPLVLTGCAAPEAGRATASAHADVVVSAAERVTPAFVVETLVARGLTRIVCEGGPTLLERFVADGVVDEADITVSPTFAGLSDRVSGDGVDVVRRLDLVHVIEAGGYLMNRYVAAGTPHR